MVHTRSAMNHFCLQCCSLRLVIEYYLLVDHGIRILWNKFWMHIQAFFSSLLLIVDWPQFHSGPKCSKLSIQSLFIQITIALLHIWQNTQVLIIKWYKEQIYNYIFCKKCNINRFNNFFTCKDCKNYFKRLTSKIKLECKKSNDNLEVISYEGCNVGNCCAPYQF